MNYIYITSSYGIVNLLNKEIKTLIFVFQLVNIDVCHILTTLAKITQNIITKVCTKLCAQNFPTIITINLSFWFLRTVSYQLTFTIKKKRILKLFLININSWNLSRNRLQKQQERERKVRLHSTVSFNFNESSKTMIHTDGKVILTLRRYR